MLKIKFTALVAAFYMAVVGAAAQSVWSPDLSNGFYRNPILHADYSDPDAVRVGGDFYMTASTFGDFPGLPILHSKDLVHWSLIGHALTAANSGDMFQQVQHGNAVWAPAIRHHKGWFYIFWGDPDRGIFRVRARQPQGPWEAPVLVKAAKGWIDPCPFWDTDGQAYLVHAFAGSRAGFKSVLTVHRMDTEGSRLLDEGVMVFDGHAAHPTCEGPKLYKHGGYYYIFTPAGGVATGWQLVLRAKNIQGPYTPHISLAQGTSPINGPHQGAWVDTPTGEHWFLHFQDKGAYGRIVHLQPLIWRDGWPVIGLDSVQTGTGQPVLSHKKPLLAPTKAVFPPENDEFNSDKIGLQWAWPLQPDPTWAIPFPSKGVLRLNAVLKDSAANYWQSPMLLQKIPAETFSATVKAQFEGRTEGERFGLVVFGLDYAALSVVYRQGQYHIESMLCKNADKNGRDRAIEHRLLPANTFYLRLTMAAGGQCTFSYSTDGETFEPIETTFTAREGKWVGAKIGFFFSRTAKTNDSGTVDVDWWRLKP